MKTIFGTILLLGLIAAGGCSGDSDQNAESEYEVTVEDLMQVLQINYFERVLPESFTTEDRVYLAYRYPDGNIKKSGGIGGWSPNDLLRIFVCTQRDDPYVAFMKGRRLSTKFSLSEPFVGSSTGPKIGTVEDFLVRFTMGKSMTTGGELPEDNFDLFLLLERSTPGEDDRDE
ncbi:MAG: hypothetical protein P9M08_01950 [Candidatus Erginobacter occultus]|nr:hypothetical protein [Candidatus Erginobacter occultus]